MSTQTDAPALAREIRQAARRREVLAAAHARRARAYRAEAAEMRPAATWGARRLRRQKADPT